MRKKRQNISTTTTEPMTPNTTMAPMATPMTSAGDASSANPSSVNPSSTISSSTISSSSTPSQSQISVHHETTYQGVPYAYIVKHLETLLGGAPEHGSRNNHIFAMACNLRYVCNDDAEWIAEICPTYGEKKEKALVTISSACNRAQGMMMSQVMQRAVMMAKAEYLLMMNPQDDADDAYPTISQPPLPDELPPFVRDAISAFPDYQKPAMALAAFTPLMSYFSGVRFRYIDNTMMEPSSMFVLAGGAGKGKGGQKLLVKALTRLMKETDEINQQRDEEWRRKDQETPDNRKHPVRPDDICFQMLTNDVTKSALTQRQGDCYRAGGKFIYSYFSEASMLKGVSNDLSELVKIAYDCDEKGAARSSSKGETGNYPLRWNFSVSCNRTVLYKTFNFRETLHDGTLQRITFALIPDRKPEPGIRGRQLVPQYTRDEDAYMQLMRPYTEKIAKLKGDYESPEELTELSFCRCDDKWDIYQNSDDEFFDEFGNRTVGISHKIGFTLYALNDFVWDECIAKFTEWAFWYEMWAKCVLLREPYYATIEGTHIDTSGNPGPTNMLTLLPNTFTYNDLQMIRNQQKKSIAEEDVRHQIAVWLSRKHIDKVPDNEDTYIKLNHRTS